MLRFACDWCERLKQPDEVWILGFAAENRGVTASRREVTVLSEWDRERAVNPFAVHFCSLNHKDKYMAALFDTAPITEDFKVRRTVPVVEEVEIHKTVPGKRILTTHKTKRSTTSRRRAS